MPLYDKAFIERTLDRVYIPKGTTEIGVCAFAYCNALRHAVVPEGVTRISSGAFDHCDQLVSISLPSSITTITDRLVGDDNVVANVYCNFAEGAVAGAPWGATNATIHYNSTGPEGA